MNNTHPVSPEAQSWLDQLDSKTREAVSKSPEIMRGIEAAEAVKAKARQMRPEPMEHVPGMVTRVAQPQPYPSMRYHQISGESRIVNNQDEDTALGSEWDRFPPKNPQPMLTADVRQDLSAKLDALTKRVEAMEAAATKRDRR